MHSSLLFPLGSWRGPKLDEPDKLDELNMNNLAFRKINYILLGIGLAVIVLGLVLMAGPGSTEEAFNPDIFSARRIKVAPLVSFFGFLFIMVAIMYKPRDKKEETTSTDNTTPEYQK